MEVAKRVFKVLLGCEGILKGGSGGRFRRKGGFCREVLRRRMKGRLKKRLKWILFWSGLETVLRIRTRF